MRGRGQLQIAVGYASLTGRRPENQDFGGVDMGSAQERALQGIVAIVADGAGAGGRTASELAVRAFLEGYRAQNGLAGIGAAAMTAVEAYNRWLHAQARPAASLEGAATTFTAAVLRGRSVTTLHVGDSRAWQLRAGVLALLTDDHAALQADGSQRLLRAIGLEPALRLDVRSERIEVHDRLLLSTDGVHAVLPRNTLAQILGRRQAPQADAEALVSAALKTGGHDNATAIVIDVLDVPAADYSMITAEMEALPIPPAPRAGDVIDGFELVRLVADSPSTSLFLAKDSAGLVALKFPKPEAITMVDRHRFMREVFLGQRIAHAFVGGSLALAEGRQSRLYVAMPYYMGETLEARLRRGPMRIDEAVSIGCKIGRGLAALHRAGVTHRDLKPQNVMLPEDGGLKIIDLGVSGLPEFEDLDEAETPGTADFMSPELFEGARGDPLSDQYALGVTLYRMLTGHYPHGETPPGSRPLFGPATPVTRYRSDAPAWLDALVLKAIAARPEDRFGDLDELVFELEHGNARAAPFVKARPLIDRNPLLLWQILCGLLLALLAISLFRR